MKFKQKWGPVTPAREGSIGEVVEREIADYDSERGALEDLQGQVRRLTQVVAIIAEAQPAHVQRAIAAHLGWEEVPGGSA